jgi:thioredoxin-dependent peroxiredoxin
MNLEGRQAPEFELEGTDGKTHRLSEYRGNTVVLYFYPRNFTPGCTKQACAFRDRFPTFQGLNVVVLGVSRDSIGSHDNFIADFHLPFVLLSDPEATTMREYGAFGEKTVKGEKTEGAIRSTVVIGPDGKILKHWPKVTNAEEHPQEVVDFLSVLKG